MANRRWTRASSVVLFLLLWLCLGVAAPIVVSLYVSDRAVDVVEAAPGDAFSLTESVELNAAPLISVSRGTIAFVDSNGNALRPEAGAAGMVQPSQSIGLVNATISIGSADTRRPAGAEAVSPYVDALVAGRYDTLLLRRVTLMVRLFGDRLETISEVRGEVSFRRRGSAIFKAAGSWRGQKVAIDATLATGLAERQAGVVQSMPVKLVLKGALVDFAFDGRLGVADGELALQGQAELAAASVRQVARWFGAAWAAGAGLRDLGIRGQLGLSRQAILFENASARLDGNEATGVVGLKLGDTRPLLTGTLAFKSFDAKPYLTGAVNEPGVTSAWLSLAAGVLTVPLGMHLDADMRVSADRVALGPVELGHSAATVTLHDGRLLADIADLKVSGGRGGGQVIADFTGFVPRFTLRGKFEEIEFGRLAAGTMIGVAPLQGKGSVMLDVAGTGETLRDVLRGLVGRIAVRSQSPGRLGLDLRALAGAAREQPTVSWEAARKGFTAYDSLDLRLVLRDGIVLTETADLTAGTGLWSATGVVNMTSDRLDLRLTESRRGAAAATGQAGGLPLPQSVIEVRGPLLTPAAQVELGP